MRIFGALLPLLAAGAVSACGATYIVADDRSADPATDGGLHVLTGDGGSTGPHGGGGRGGAGGRPDDASAGSSPSAGGGLAGANGAPAADSGAGLGFNGALPDSGVLPPALAEQGTVWIGEVEHTVTYPEVNPDVWTPPQRVVLVLDRVNGGNVTGTITFGEGPPPDSASRTDLMPESSSDGWQGWSSKPDTAFEYSLVNAHAYGARLSVQLRPNERWRDWCALGESSWGGYPLPCDCSGGACVVAGGPLVRLDLVASGDSMAGEYSGVLQGFTLAYQSPFVKLRRVR